MERTLDVRHFHAVFTLPQELRPLALRSPKVIYGLLFKAASQTLMQLGADPKWLGAKLGVTMVLHTLILQRSGYFAQRRNEIESEDRARMGLGAADPVFPT